MIVTRTWLTRPSDGPSRRFRRSPSAKIKQRWQPGNRPILRQPVFAEFGGCPPDLSWSAYAAANSPIQKLVGPVRLELTTPCTPCKCATRLRHGPNQEAA